MLYFASDVATNQAAVDRLIDSLGCRVPVNSVSVNDDLLNLEGLNQPGMPNNDNNYYIHLDSVLFVLKQYYWLIISYIFVYDIVVSATAFDCTLNGDELESASPSWPQIGSDLCFPCQAPKAEATETSPSFFSSSVARNKENYRRYNAPLKMNKAHRNKDQSLAAADSDALLLLGMTSRSPSIICSSLANLPKSEEYKPKKRSQGKL